jgi:hypothetical protein
MPSHCPYCSQPFGDVPRLAGKSIDCPSCHREFVFTPVPQSELVGPVPALRRKSNHSLTMWAIGIATLCWLMSPGVGYLLSSQSGFWFWCIGATVLYAGAMAILGVTLLLKLKSRH